jgi:hypothetical protein
MDFKNQLLANRPNLSKSSLTSYISLLNSLTKKMNGFCDYNNSDCIIKWLDENCKNINSRKTILSALYVLTLNECYKTTFIVDCNTVRENDMKNEMNEKQIENYVSYDNILKKYQYIKDNLNTENIINYRDFVALSLMAGIHIPPRRLLDWVELKHSNFTKGDNYIDKEKSCLVFNKYKTVKKYGEQVIPIPKELLELLMDFKKFSKNDYLLFNINGDKMDVGLLNKLINDIFGCKLGCNGLRHSYISSYVLPHLPKVAELNRIAYQMGHSLNTQLIYKKNVPILL